MTKEEQDKLILDNIPLIYKVIKDLRCYWKTEDEWQDLYDCGLEGLINGVKKYNVSKSNSSTYLYRSIKNSILKYFTLSGCNNRKINREINTSLNSLVGTNQENELMDFIEDTSVNIEEEVDNILLKELILEKVNSLKSKKQIRSLKMHFGLDGFEPMTYREIAKIYGVSKNAVAENCIRGIEKLREELKCIKKD